MSSEVPLPHSGKGPYKGNYWGIIERDLGALRNGPTYAKMEELILKYVGRNAKNTSSMFKLENLRSIFSEDSGNMAGVPFIAMAALQLPKLFPGKSISILRRGERGSVELTRKQVACLVANMFFCTLQPNEELGKEGIRGHLTGVRAPTGPLTFVFWHRLISGPTKTYLNSLINYFKDLNGSSEEKLSETVSFKRLVCSDENKSSWEPKNSHAEIVEVHVHNEGRIGDREQVEIDFANANVGFGTTGTQEELMLGTSPETTVVVLFTEQLGDEEALLITGAKKYGDFSGYGSSVRYTGNFTGDWDWAQRKIVAIDAIPGPTDQLGERSLRREVRKVWTGLSSVPELDVATGHWGCGAFGGDQEVKAIVQLMGASLAGVRRLDFYSFGDAVFHKRFEAALEALKGVSVGVIWERLKLFRSKSGMSGARRDSLLTFIASFDEGKQSIAE